MLAGKYLVTNLNDQFMRLVFEPLEEKEMLTVAPQFTGPFGLSVGPIVNITKAAGNQTQGTIAVDPTTYTISAT